MDSRYMLGAIGLLVGASIAMLWELKTMPAAASEPAAATSANEADGAAAMADGFIDEPGADEPDRPDPSSAGRAAAAATAAHSPHVQLSQHEAPSSGSQLPTPAADPSSSARSTAPSPPPAIDPAQIRIKRVLVGGELIAARIVPESVLDEQEKHSKYVICFEISTAQEPQPGAPRLRWEDFRLEDDHGVIASPLSEVPHPRSATSSHTSVFFAIYNDSAPARLLYRTADGDFHPLPAPSRP